MNLKEGTREYSNGVIYQVMNGLPRDMLQSEINIQVWLYSFLDPFFALLVNDFLARVIAFAGMFFLLKTHVLNQNSNKNLFVAFTLSILFSYLGGNTIYGGLTVMGQPLLLFAVLNFYKNKRHWYDYAIIIIFPFWSSFFLSGLFIVVTAGLGLVYIYFRDKKIRWDLVILLTVFSLLYVVIEYNLILGYINPNEIVSHRVEFQLIDSPLFNKVRPSIALIASTQYHTGKIVTLFIIGLSILTTLWNRKINPVLAKLYLLVGICVLVFMIYSVITPLLVEGSVFKAFNWSRFYFLLPCLWIIILALTIQDALKSNARFVKICAYLTVILAFLSIVHGNEELKYNCYRLLDIKKGVNPSYREFFAEDLFAQIDTEIGKEKSAYRVISFGLHPSIAIYNGFYTLDGYFNNYPLAHKHAFREIIAPELAKDDVIREYYDSWGSRCYLSSATIGQNYMWSKTDNKTIDILDIDTEAFKRMGGEYIISTIEILNPHNLKLVNEFEQKDSFWRIYLYKVL